MLCPDSVSLSRVPLGQRPSLFSLRQSCLPPLFDCIFGTMLLSDFQKSCIAGARNFSFPARSSSIPSVGKFLDLPVPVYEASTHAKFFDSVGSHCTSRITLQCILPSPSEYKIGTQKLVISELNCPPVCSPVNASARMLPPSPHDSGSV